MGNVYMFNLNGVAIDTLQINQRLVQGGIAAWSEEVATKYQPKQVSVPRSPLPAKDLSEPMFSQEGANKVFVEWHGGNETANVVVTIAPLDANLRQDFLLYLAPSQSILFDSFGSIVENGVS